MNSTLIHWGIKGMHWGQRKNSTGTSLVVYKEKSKGDGNKTSGENKKEPKSVNYDHIKGKIGSASKVVDESKKIDTVLHESKVKKQKDEIKKIDLSNYNDDELKRVVTRMNMEKQYKTLTAEMTVKGESKAKKILESTGTALVVANSAIALIAAMDQLTKKKK